MHIWPVSYFYSNKSWWICTLLLGTMQQCKCREHLPNTFCTFAHAFDIFFLHFCFPLCSCLRFSIEFMFVHSNGGQGWSSKPHPLRPHCIWDNHCRSRCQDSQNDTSRGHRRGKAVFLHKQCRFTSHRNRNSWQHSCDLRHMRSYWVQVTFFLMFIPFMRSSG